ncbi:hypothetical protein D3C75_487940 [compost metagenome]
MAVRDILTDQELDILGDSFAAIKNMDFVHFVEAVRTNRLQLNFKGATTRQAMDRFEQPLWGEEPEPTEQDPIDNYKTKRDEELENDDN